MWRDRKCFFKAILFDFFASLSILYGHPATGHETSPWNLRGMLAVYCVGSVLGVTMTSSSETLFRTGVGGAYVRAAFLHFRVSWCLLRYCLVTSVPHLMHCTLVKIRCLCEGPSHVTCRQYAVEVCLILYLPPDITINFVFDAFITKPNDSKLLAMTSKLACSLPASAPVIAPS